MKNNSSFIFQIFIFELKKKFFLFVFFSNFQVFFCFKKLIFEIKKKKIWKIFFIFSRPPLRSARRFKKSRPFNWSQRQRQARRALWRWETNADNSTTRSTPLKRPRLRLLVRMARKWPDSLKYGPEGLRSRLKNLESWLKSLKSRPWKTKI